MIGLTWNYVQRRRAWPYFERVASESNPVDGLSRRDFRGPWGEVHKAEIPVQELLALACEAGGAA